MKYDYQSFAAIPDFLGLMQPFLLLGRQNPGGFSSCIIAVVV
jgi:hypothetical protein